jgi:LAS superfamily LD-carboxypeptidase LdcB
LQWDGASAEQLDFMRRVYERQVNNAAQRRSFVGDVPAAELAEIENGVRARTAAAAACQDMLAAARADLQQQKQSGVQRIHQVEAIRITSGYRSASQQFTSWQNNFPMYYDRTRSQREALSGGPHGDEAVRKLAKYIGGILGAPGYSLHNNGLAVDLSVTEGGVRLRASSNAENIRRWRQSWFFEWLANNAARFNYYQNTAIDEPWHWEYRGNAAQLTQTEDDESERGEHSLIDAFPIADERFDHEQFEFTSIQEDNPSIHTVLDGDARIRSGPPEWRPTGNRIPKYTRVRIQEIQGNYAKVTGVDGNDYGWTAQSNLGTFYKDSELLSAIPLVPLLPIPIASDWSDLKRSLARIYNRLGGLMTLLSTNLGIELPAILAVWYVESAGRSHTPNQAIIRFENHLFYRKWGKENQTSYNQHFQHGGHNGISGEAWQNHKFREMPTEPFQTFHGDQTREYQVLAFASRLAGEDIALQCISIGGPQILISGYRMLGYSTPRELYDAFQSGERPQVLGFFDFCQYKLGHGRNRGALLRHLAALNWEEFARGYNGAGKVATYSRKLREAYTAAQDIFPTAAPAAQSIESNGFPASFRIPTFPEFVVVSAGRDELANVPLLRGHRGTPPDLILRWNDMALAPTRVDVVVHLHGYSDDRDRMVISRIKETNSGFINPSNSSDLSLGRNRPTLAILPRGNYFGGRSGKGYDFPALITSSGLRDLIDFCLHHFAKGFGLSNLQVGRLILSAHSGGGAPLMRILRHSDPHEVHVFDALYQDASSLIRWARDHIRRDQAALEAPISQDARQYIREQGGALRVFYRGGTGTESHSLAIHRALVTALPTSPSPAAVLSDWYRVERTSVGHGDIPRTYGFQLLGDAGIMLANAFTPR